MPIVLDVTAAVAATITPNQQLNLRDAEGVTLPVLNVEELWQPDKTREAERVYSTDSPQHPGVRELYAQVHEVYVGGTVTGLQLPAHREFTALWLTPQTVRQQFAAREWRRVVGFHTRRPLHRREFEITTQPCSVNSRRCTRSSSASGAVSMAWPMIQTRQLSRRIRRMLRGKTP